MATYESDNKNWATEYLLGPLNEPTPAEETGLASSSFQPANTTVPSRKLSKSSARSSKSVKDHKTGTSTTTTASNTNPFRRNSPPSSSSKAKSAASTHTREVSNGSASNSPPRRFPDLDDGLSRRRSTSHSKPNSPDAAHSTTRVRRSSSLRERYPGDTSHHPLATLAKDTKTAYRSPHLRKKHHQGSDSIDKLDDASLTTYHHESAYDVASLARNNSYTHAPLAALTNSTRETLRATPREKINDSLRRHRPLDGVADYPPGQPDPLGRIYTYEEGPNMMIEHGGNYKRWPGVDYLPEDIKGKGEPSYTIEKQLKEHDAKSREHPSAPNGDGSFELVERPAHSRRSHEYAAVSGSSDRRPFETGGEEATRPRGGSETAQRGNGDVKRRFGSLRKRDRPVGAAGE